MGSNVKLSADERTLWMMAYAAALGGYWANPSDLSSKPEHFAGAADAAILAMRERVAVEATGEATTPASESTGEAEPPLTPERAREVMREYVARGEWRVDYDDRGRAKYCGESFADGSTAEVVIADGYDVRAWPLTDGQQMTPITTESALRAFCEGRKA